MKSIINVSEAIEPPLLWHAETLLWQEQLKKSITDISQVKDILNLDDDKIAESLVLPFRVTPYYLELAKTSEAIQQCIIPTTDELILSYGESCDPLDEEHDSPVPGLVHRYPDRVLFLATDFCSTNCRYCTRSRMINDKQHYLFDIDKRIEYIEAHPKITDVLISGGDPLTLSDEKLDYLLSRITSIPTVEIVRIGTKCPVVLPQRITHSLISILKKYKPLFMSIHFTHPDELTEECKKACTMLSDAGIVLGSQTVLLKGINDDSAILSKLFKKLLTFQVRPYYLYQCDPIRGSKHFRTPIEQGLAIMSELIGKISGYAIPSFVVDLPNGGGKTPLLPTYYQGLTATDYLFQNYKGSQYSYPID